MTDSDVRPGRSVEVNIATWNGVIANEAADRVATEEPLEIRLSSAGVQQSLALTMRTPGNDFELAAGFLFNEGIVSTREDILNISYCLDREPGIEQRYNIVNVEMRSEGLPDIARFERHFMTYGGCGICGRESLDALSLRGLTPMNDLVRVSIETLYALPDRMRAAQKIFERTGGLHATALFDERGTLISLREDVGRHNAFDKVVGEALLAGRLPLTSCVALVSGRASYELAQKALSAGIPILASISAPSSLAIDLALRFNVTLVGFLRERRANIYSGSERVVVSAPPPLREFER